MAPVGLIKPVSAIRDNKNCGYVSFIEINVLVGDFLFENSIMIVTRFQRSRLSAQPFDVDQANALKLSHHAVIQNFNPRFLYALPTVDHL